MLWCTNKPTLPTLNSPINGMKQSLLTSDTIGIIRSCFVVWCFAVFTVQDLVIRGTLAAIPFGAVFVSASSAGFWVLFLFVVVVLLCCLFVLVF